MTKFDQFVARHGEVVTQSLIENLEHAEGVQSEQMTTKTLEERWQRLMKQGAF